MMGASFVRACRRAHMREDAHVAWSTLTNHVGSLLHVRMSGQVPNDICNLYKNFVNILIYIFILFYDIHYCFISICYFSCSEIYSQYFFL